MGDGGHTGLTRLIQSLHFIQILKASFAKLLSFHV